MGGSDGSTAVGEGPCNPNTGVCQNPTTQGPSGPVACPNNNFTDGTNCEYSDSNCFAQGTRTAFLNGSPVTESSRANQCLNNKFQNGDLDFDGLDYVPNSWPDGTANHPTAFQYAGPFMASGQPYPRIQYETDLAASEILCNVATGAGCTAPPTGAKFYPFWSMLKAPTVFGSQSTSCLWSFGNVVPNTFETFGKDAEYGTPDVARFGGTLTSAVLPNPEFSGACRR